MPQQISLSTLKQRKRAAVRTRIRETAKRRRRIKARLVEERAIQGSVEIDLFGPGEPIGRKKRKQ